jgi:hypothetical protein
MTDPNEIKINPSLDTHGLSEHEYMERISAWREAVSARYMPEPLEDTSWVDTFRAIMNEPGIRRILAENQHPVSISEPREPSILDILTHAPIEMPEHRVTWHQRVDDPDNIDSNINEI